MRRVLLASLLLCLVAAPAAARQAADADKAAVDAAVRKAFSALRSQNASHLQTFESSKRPVSIRELVVYTYVIGGATESEEDFKLLFEPMLKDKLDSTYAV